MWIFTKYGFITVSQHKRVEEQFMIKSRVRTPLDILWPESKITILPEVDYRFRISIPKTEAMEVLSNLISSIDYSNFKNACEEDAAYRRTLNKIWIELSEYQFRVEHNRH